MSNDMDRRIAGPWWRSRRAAMAAAGAGGLAVLLLVGMAFASGAERSVRVPQATVTIDAVRQGVFQDFTPLNGKVTPHDTIILGALEGGQVERVLVQGGDMVTAGQPLMAFGNTQLELDVLDREGRLLESITQLQSFEKQLEDTRAANERAAASIDYNISRLTALTTRRRDLAAKGFVAGEAYEQLQQELEYNNKLRPLQAETNQRHEKLRADQLPRVQDELQRLRKSLEITRSKIDNLVVKAPVSGQLIDFDPNIGQNFNRGDRLGEIVLATGFKVAANVDQYYLGRVRPGQAASAQIKGRPWKLRVDRVYPQVKDGTFVVDLVFDGAAPDGLLPGETITGRLSLGGDQPALTLPARPFLQGSNGDWVMVMTGERRAERRRVRIGRRNIEQVEVLSGLKSGERVITSDYSAFEKIDRVDLTN